jgi:hypothetical protein
MATTYVPNDTVARSGSTYICLISNTNSDPLTDVNNWNLMAQIGATGPTGQQGVAGTPGSKWYNGSSDPVTVSGAIPGDYYLNSTSGDVFTL